VATLTTFFKAIKGVFAERKKTASGEGSGEKAEGHRSFQALLQREAAKPSSLPFPAHHRTQSRFVFLGWLRCGIA
jgi:hypothetical protein